MEKLNFIKISTILLLIILLIPVFSGCIHEESNRYYSKIYENASPVTIDAPDKAFFDEEIEFDAYCDESEYKITSYRWNFQDGKDIIGKNVKHKYFFENKFEIEYPVIYTITLFTTFSDKSIRATKHLIKVYPKEFIFYLQKNKLSKNEPSLNYERLTDEMLSFNKQKELIYSFDDPIYIDKCDWDLILNIKKPLFLTIKNIKITFYNKENSIVDEKQFENIFKIGLKNAIKVSGKFNQEYEIEKIKISFSIFSFRNDISLIYGGYNPSNICFRFD